MGAMHADDYCALFLAQSSMRDAYNSTHTFLDDVNATAIASETRQGTTNANNR